MVLYRVFGRILAAAALASGALPAAAATAISFQLVDLTDIAPDQDLWRYDYRITGGFAQFSSIEILYPAPQVASITPVVPSPNPGWDISVIQPIAGIPADGIYTLVALSDSPALASAFQATFVWKGPGIPATQAFNVMDGSFSLLESGTTVPTAIPEPALFAQLALGLVLIAVRLRRRRRV